MDFICVIIYTIKTDNCVMEWIMNNITLTVIIPAFNEGGNVERVTEKVYEVLKDKVNFEILFVDDGSKDDTWSKMSEMSKKYSFVRALKFSRNFGKEAAVYAGLLNAAGECAVVIDSDLQHPPEKILDMYKEWQNGYKVVECVKSSRGKENGAHGFAANMFYGIMSKLMNFDMANYSDFKLLDRKAINAILSMPEKNTFFRASSAWVGFKTTKVEFEVGEREDGESKWPIKSLIKYALNNIALFSNAPLQIVSVLSVICFIAGIVFGGISVYRVMNDLNTQLMTILSAQCILSGSMLAGMGIMGFYMSKMFDEIKGRPKYLIEEECNEHKCDKEVCR